MEELSEELLEKAIEEGAKARYAEAMRRHGYNPRSWWRIPDSIREACRHASRTVLEGAGPVLIGAMIDQLKSASRDLKTVGAQVDEIVEQRDKLLDGVLAAVLRAEGVGQTVVSTEAIRKAIANSSTGETDGKR